MKNDYNFIPFKQFAHGLNYIITSPFVITKKVFYFTTNYLKSPLSKWRLFLAWSFNTTQYQNELYALGKYHQIIYQSIQHTSFYPLPLNPSNAKSEREFPEDMKHVIHDVSYYEYELHSKKTIARDLEESYTLLKQEHFKIFKSNHQSLISEMQTQVLLFNQTIIPRLELNLNTLREHRKTNETVEQTKIINELIDKNKQSTEASVQEMGKIYSKCLKLEEVKENYEKMIRDLEEYKVASTNKYEQEIISLKEQVDKAIQEKETQTSLTETEKVKSRPLMQTIHEHEKTIWELNNQLIGQKEEYDNSLSIEKLRITNLKKEIIQLKVQHNTLNTTLNEQQEILIKTRNHRDEYKTLAELSYPDNQSNPNKLFQTASKPLHAIITLLDNFHDTLLSKIRHITQITEDIQRVQNFNLERQIKTVKLSLELSTNQEEINKIDLLYSLMNKNQTIQHNLSEYTELTIERDRLKELISQIFKDLKAIKDIDFGAHKEEEHLMLRQKQLQEEITAFSTDFEINFTKLKNDYAKYEALLFNHTEATKQQVVTSRRLLEASRKPIPGKNSGDNLLKRALEPPNVVETTKSPVQNATKSEPSQQHSAKIVPTTSPTNPALIALKATLQVRTRGLTAQIKNDLPSVLSKFTALSPPKTVSDSEVD